MAKDITKKWLVLLIVLVALSLVVDLLALNVVYSSDKEESNLEGSLDSLRWTWGDPDHRCYRILTVRDSTDDCSVNCMYNYAACEYNKCRDMYSYEDCSQYGSSCLRDCAY